MSRIGKTPVLIPDKVTVDFDGLTVTVKGPKGELKRQMPEGVSFDKKVLSFLSKLTPSGI